MFLWSKKAIRIDKEKKKGGFTADAEQKEMLWSNNTEYDKYNPKKQWEKGSKGIPAKNIECSVNKIGNDNWHCAHRIVSHCSSPVSKKYCHIKYSHFSASSLQYNFWIKKTKQAECERVKQYHKCRLCVWFHFALQHTRIWKATNNTFVGNMQPL